MALPGWLPETESKPKKVNSQTVTIPKDVEFVFSFDLPTPERAAGSSGTAKQGGNTKTSTKLPVPLSSKKKTTSLLHAMCMCLHTGLLVHCRPCAVLSLSCCVLPGGLQATLSSSLSPSDRLSLCRERFIVFESCQDVKRSRSPSVRRASTGPAPSWKVGGNVAPLIGH